MEAGQRDELTRLLRKFPRDSDAADDAWRIIYPEILALAKSQRRRWDGDWTMETAVLANEAFLKVFSGTPPDFNDRRHFYRLLSTAIRQILVNYGQARKTRKRGGGAQHVPLDVAEGLGLAAEAAEQVRDLDRALEKLREMDARAAEVVELKFFVGLGNAEIAEVLGVSRPTVIRDWAAAKAWLWKEIGEVRAAGDEVHDSGRDSS
jgi:RNA polymerase sigma factor (TIGR02999 family)